jgi:methionyl-tRNA synthetase
VIPNISSNIYQQLGFGIDFNEQTATAPFEIHSQWGLLSHKQNLGEPQPIFKRIETPKKA